MKSYEKLLKSAITYEESRQWAGGENPSSLNLSLGWPSVWRAKVMVFHRFSIGSGGGENPDSLNLSLGWPSVWRAITIGFP